MVSHVDLGSQPSMNQHELIKWNVLREGEGFSPDLKQPNHYVESRLCKCKDWLLKEGGRGDSQNAIHHETYSEESWQAKN